MTTRTDVSTIEHNLHETNIWLNELSEALGDTTHEDAWHCMRAVLQTLRDRLPVEEAANFSAQLPILIRGLYYEGWKPERTPTKLHTKEAFLDAVVHRMGRDMRMDPEVTVKAVLTTLKKHVDAPIVEHLRMLQPEALRSLWPDASEKESPTSH